MAKITLDPITGSFASVTALNSRFQQIEDAFNDNVFWRLNIVGEPNTLSNDLDMNNNDILNLNAPLFNHSPARLQDILDASASLSSTSAVATTLADTGLFYNASNVEGALAELASVSTGEGASIIGIEDAGGYYSGLNVEAALQENGKDAVQTFTNKTHINPIINTGVSGTANIMRMLEDTPQTTTSGLTKDFTPPLWSNEITASFHLVSTTGTNIVGIRLGDSGGIKTTGYKSTVGNASGVNKVTDRFAITRVLNDALAELNGSIILTLIDSTNYIWTITGTISDAYWPDQYNIGGKIQLSGPITTVQFIVQDIYDAGSVNILSKGYEG